MQAAIHQIVTFATDVFAGNPAFVMTVREPVEDHIVQKVASQLGETVLSCLRRIDQERFELRFHTPSGPHGGTGHATAAASHVMLLETGADRGTLVLADGSERTIHREGSRTSVPWPTMPFAAVDLAGTLASALGVPVRKALDSDFGYIAICDGPEPIARMHPDLDAIARLDRGTVIATARGEASDIVIRVFAPKLGLPEDPVCGTAHRIIVPYWSEQLGRTSIHSRQMSPRGGDLWCRLDGDNVVISGESKAFLAGALDLP
ncbi:MAG: PhzF family phenazine biosynthesis protein [Bauldia sp.]|nr:PhzF family phenazine biosynthesis protein [Bauldia sp.]